MITLSASGGSVTFTFDGNSTYLNDGTIEVPKNSLALIIDESDMITFRKSASNDIFVSANIAEFGMTKDELMAWYKANMVGSTGGEGGVTSGEVQTMIDEAVSGKANSSDVTEEISAAVSGKVDTEDLNISGKTLYGEVSTILQDDVSSKQYKSFILRLNRKSSINQRSLVSFDVYSNGSSVTTLSLYAVVSAADGFTSANLDNTTYANVAIVDDGMGLLVTFADGYYLGTYTRTPSYTTYFQMEFPSIVITSGSTPTVVEQGVYDALETISDAILADENNIATISAKTLNALTAASINYYDNNIRLNKWNISGASSTSDLAVDNSLSYHNGKLGVYTTGATHTISLNDSRRSASNYAVSNYSGVVKMYINQSYTGTTPTTRALSFDTNSEYGSYTYDSGTDEFTPDGTYTTVAFAYDKTNHLVTFTTLNDATFSYLGSNGYIAPVSALTQEDCFIGLVTIDTNSYKLQEALDNKVDTSDITTSITSGDTNPVAGGALYDELRIVDNISQSTQLIWLDWGDGVYCFNLPSNCYKIEFVGGNENAEVNITVNSTKGFVALWSGNTWTVSSISQGLTTIIDGSKLTLISSDAFTDIRSGYYSWSYKTTSYAIVESSSVTPLIDKVKEDEQVTAAALNELNARIAALEAIIQNMNN